MNIEQITYEIIEFFEELLDNKDITIPNDDREGKKGEARIYGSDFYVLEDDIKNLLEKHYRENIEICAKCGKNISRITGFINKGRVYCSRECLLIEEL